MAQNGSISTTTSSFLMICLLIDWLDLVQDWPVSLIFAAKNKRFAFHPGEVREFPDRQLGNLREVPIHRCQRSTILTFALQSGRSLHAEGYSTPKLICFRVSQW